MDLGGKKLKILLETAVVCVGMSNCNNNRFYGILHYDGYREFTGITGDIRGFFVIIKWFLGVCLFNGIKYLFY